jgi:chromosome segregation ATPase
MSDEQLRYEEEKYQYEESHREMKYPRTNNAYHKSRRDNSDRIDALLAECEKMEDELAAQGKLERELATVTEQRDRLAEELKEAQNAIEMMLRDSSCRRIPAYTEEQLTAVKGVSDE